MMKCLANEARDIWMWKLLPLLLLLIVELLPAGATIASMATDTAPATNATNIATATAADATNATNTATVAADGSYTNFWCWCY